MTGVRYLILLSLILVIFGCFAPQSHLSLPGTDKITEPIAILPVIPSKVVLHYTDSKRYYMYWAKKSNEILNTLSSGKKSILMGPKEVYKLLETSEIEYLNSILDESEIKAELWESKSFGNISKKLGVAKIIRVSLEIWDYEPKAYEEFGGFGGSREDHGWVHVDMELIKLSPPSLVKTSFGGVEHGYKLTVFGGVGGGGCCFIPTHFSSKYKARAADEALRQALSELLATSDREATVQ